MSVHFLRLLFTLSDSFCGGMKAFLDRASVNGDFGEISETELKMRRADLSSEESHIG